MLSGVVGLCFTFLPCVECPLLSGMNVVVSNITTAGYRQPIRSILIDEVVEDVSLTDKETDDLQNMNSRLLMTRHACGHPCNGVGW